ncbi:MAG TPA: iron-containing alcohol dehydrogenase [Candidatus Limnocylindrales bacterium]
MKFEFATASRIVFGPGVVEQLGTIARPLGRRALLVGGRSHERVTAVATILEAAGIEVVPFVVGGEPSLELVREGTSAARQASVELVVAFGGGSVIDAGKAIAALVTNDGEPLDYLEVIGRGRALTLPSLPVIAVPTTAGTGAEVTRNAVIRSPGHGVKASLRSPTMLPQVALVDPELSVGVPPTVRATTGLDALAQAIEPYVSRRANPVSDALCREAIARSARSLRRAYEDGTDGTAREDLALSALLGGMALANAGLGAIHGFAAPIGGAFERAPHGAICGRLLPIVIAANVAALRQREPGSPTLGRYAELAGMLTGDGDASPEAGIAWIEDLVAALGVPGLSAYGVGESDLGGLVEAGQAARSMQANPVLQTAAELRDILVQAL